MEYVILDTFNGNISLITDEDGNTKIFNDVNKAVEELKNQQEGIVVPLVDILSIMRSSLNFISGAKFNLISEQDDDFIEHKLTDILYKTY